jgi:hypothetical protein
LLETSLQVLIDALLPFMAAVYSRQWTSIAPDDHLTGSLKRDAFTRKGDGIIGE